MHRTFAPIPVGTRVRLLNEYAGAQPGTLGTVTWKHPMHIDGVPGAFHDFPYRVRWDGHEPKPGTVVFGMDDIGWLMREDEIEEVS